MAALAELLLLDANLRNSRYKRLARVMQYGHLNSAQSDVFEWLPFSMIVSDHTTLL